jgi:protein phosphatase
LDLKNAISVVRMSDVGKMRERNEDAVASDLSTGLVLVADGMGGYKAGDIASQMTALTVSAEVAELMHQLKKSKKKVVAATVAHILSKTVALANEIVYRTSQEHPVCAGMGTTFVGGIFSDNKIIVGHIGDSRLYRLRAGELKQLTEDHSLLQEQINAGLITQEQAKASNDGHLVTRALGTDPEVELELNEYDTEIGDYYLFCSDGLTDLVDDNEIQDVMIDAHDDIRLMAKNLVRLANKYGGTDNVSVVIAFVKDTFTVKHGWIHQLLG